MRSCEYDDLPFCVGFLGGIGFGFVFSLPPYTFIPVLSKYTIDDDDDDTDSLVLSPFHMSIANFSLTEAAVVLSLEYSIENVHLYVP